MPSQPGPTPLGDALDANHSTDLRGPATPYANPAIGPMTAPGSVGGEPYGLHIGSDRRVRS